ncbi:CDP-glucose 4,6-dehydratase [Paucimonas lemoignei]|uniref:CDP-glucose 4,6-dehydratase n=1 Tax=Paucimonas lemoignei TaxID=29443 RepID=A0A4R3HQS7_PAULE|nr:CDP-glucose 4,6-dehydratase [Paucimonas lemoignei]TCS35114.1 CDP-glucose 4,6-dehydratase [Paucimonas lemoignei]
MTPDFWRGKRVFLTGHTGFKGSWMSLWLQCLGAELTGFALKPPTLPSLFEQARVAEGMHSIIGDIRDPASLSEAMQAARPEIVFHMAAQPLVRYSYQNPVETYATNVMGTVNLLEAVRSTPGVISVVNITTDKCYENREWDWGYRENEPMGGFDPYSNSKGCAELVSAAYRSSFFNAATYAQHGVSLATVRAGNVIGGGDWAQDRLIPDIVGAFEQGKVVNIRNPHAIRPWQHVLEPLRGYLTLAERLEKCGPEYSTAWNFGPVDEDARSVGWIVEKMAGLWGTGARWEVDSGMHPHEATYLKLDISKARNRLGWHPLLRLDDGLQLIVDWSRQRLAGADVRQLTLKQIHDYQTLTQK